MTFVSLLYLILAILGLSFLIFIHELGHYFMARRLGMRVETFSIGFGKPIYTWVRDGVKWQIGWLIFGGFVKIAGMDTGDEQDLYEIKDGFFGKRPIDRIKVAFMGPFVNLVFALIAFAILWGIGGREKNFGEFTHKIGWIDPKSELYAKGLRPGDEIDSYNGQPFQGSKDHVTAPMMADGEVSVKGHHIKFHTKEPIPFEYTVKTYPHPNAFDKDILTTGIIQSAGYVLYDRLPGNKENPLPEGSPMEGSGIKYGDRIVWADGVPIYSLSQLSHLVNDPKALLVIKRDQENLLRRVPRVMAEELKLDSEFKEELIDWQFEAELNQVKLQKLYTIPYNLNNECMVESQVKFIDNEHQEEAFPKKPDSDLDMPLEAGDVILAVDGAPVKYSYEILAALQQRHVNLIVERDPKLALKPAWQNADKLFDHQFRADDLDKLVSQIGLVDGTKYVDNLYLLNPVVPKTKKDFKLSPENQAQMAHLLKEQMMEIENIEDPEKRAIARHLLEMQDKQLLLGLPSPLQDEHVQYNPNPFALFEKVMDEIWYTLKALLTGSLNPKWMTGPIGIVQVVHDNSMGSLKEALFWLGAISLNLGILNLLPLPVLDGGTICLSFFELVTGKRLKQKTLEKLIIPFAVLLIGFFIFITYHDLARIFTHWSH